MVCKEIIYKWIWKEKRRDNDEMAIDALAPYKDMIHKNGLAGSTSPKAQTSTCIHKKTSQK